MSGVVEVATVDDVTRWDEDLQALTDGLGWLFNRPEPRVTLGLMVRGLLADVAKKNSWAWPSIWGWRPRSRWSICWVGPGGTRMCCAIRCVARCCGVWP